MLWQITSFPPCQHHAFLSHCAEDRGDLVLPVFTRLAAAGYIPWFDQEHYPYGRDSRTSLRDGILVSRHTVFFVTPAMLSVARGWCVMELAFAEILELNLTARGGKLANPFLPLFLLPQNYPDLRRSVWQAVRDRGKFFDPPNTESAVAWCAREIAEFLVREQGLAKFWARTSKNNPATATDLRQIPGRFERVTQFQPRPRPPTPRSDA